MLCATVAKHAFTWVRSASPHLHVALVLESISTPSLRQNIVCRFGQCCTGENGTRGDGALLRRSHGGQPKEALNERGLPAMSVSGNQPCGGPAAGPEEMRRQVEVVAPNPQSGSEDGAVKFRRYAVDEKVTPGGGFRNAVAEPGVHFDDLNVVSGERHRSVRVHVAAPYLLAVAPEKAGKQSSGRFFSGDEYFQERLGCGQRVVANHREIHPRPPNVQDRGGNTQASGLRFFLI
jgi:hypothetical protein